MKAQLDENLPPSLARALGEIVAHDGHTVDHVKDYARGRSDLQVFEAAVARGITVHISQDHHHRKGLEKEAIARLGLTVFVLASGWNGLGHYRKAALLIDWWPNIVTQANLAAPGSIFVVPMRTPVNGRFKVFTPRK